ncbi:MAG TPA: PRC and DUF2382 domain-containing protein [Nocardioides sp.]|nr:PRC and DUF2382 domain-containing protein [Nocardioides sp.]
MLTQDQLREVIGSTAYGSDGEKLGKVGQVYLDDRTGEPEFASVNTGFFGTDESFVPLERASFEGDRLSVPYVKDQVKEAPKVSPDAGHIDESEEQRLYAHYGIEGGDTTTAGQDAPVRAEGHDTSGPTTDDAMTRSEERLNVGTTEQERGRARLRKYVTTEHETHTVPVRKERAVLETEPITDANVDPATDGPQISEEEHEVVLHEERPVVEKTTEPVERVRLGTQTEVEEQQVTEEVRKEEIDVEGDAETR